MPFRSYSNALQIIDVRKIFLRERQSVKPIFSPHQELDQIYHYLFAILLFKATQRGLAVRGSIRPSFCVVFSSQIAKMGRFQVNLRESKGTEFY